MPLQGFVESPKPKKYIYMNKEIEDIIAFLDTPPSSVHTIICLLFTPVNDVARR